MTVESALSKMGSASDGSLGDLQAMRHVHVPHGKNWVAGGAEA